MVTIEQTDRLPSFSLLNRGAAMLACGSQTPIGASPKFTHSE